MAEKIVKITSTANIRINTGNFESVDISKSISMEVRVRDQHDMKRKSDRLDELLNTLLKGQAERLMDKYGRKRYAKVSGTDKQVELWEEFDQQNPFRSAEGR